MPTDTRRFFESRFGRSLDHVRLHVGDNVEWLAGSLGARAFTVGSDVFVRNSEYHPDTNVGRELLAHEIAHTVQQRGEQPRVQRANEASIDPIQEITWGRINDSYALLDLLRGLSRAKLKSTLAGLQEFLESGNLDEDLAGTIQMAIEEINNILAGKTEAITIKRCESTTPMVPQSVWLADPGLEAIMNGSQAAMRVGNSGFHVRLVQNAMRYWGCEHAIPRGEHLGKYGADGVYGKYTKRAVQAFQKQRGLQVDGRVGPATLTSLEEIAVAPDGETDAPKDVTCPPRLAGEYEWAKSVPLSLSWSVVGEDKGKEIRKWILSGFPISAAAPLASQGSIVSKLRDVFLRLGPDGVRRRDEGDICEKLTRKVEVFGAGDCYAPELTTHLKSLRHMTVSEAWPDSMRRYLIDRNETNPAGFEDSFGKFPAGTNASREDRAKNRGVVLLERIDADPRENDETMKKYEDALVRLRVARDFRKLYEKASKRVQTAVYECMLKRMMFDRNMPVDTPQNQFVAGENQVTELRAGELRAGIPPSEKKSYHLGSYLFDLAVRRHIWIPTGGDDPLTICGQEQSPASDPEEAMFQAISSMLDAVERGKSVMIKLKESEHGIAIQGWFAYNDKIGGLLSCYPEKGLFG